MAVVLRLALLDRTAAAQSAPAMVQVKDAWVRWLPGDVPSGGYATLVNPGDRPVSLVAVSSADYRDVSLHRTSEVNGTSRMTPVDHIGVAPHSSLEFAAQGYHLMLSHPTRALKPGDSVTCVLKFADGAVLTVPFALRAPGDVGDVGGKSDMSDMPDMPGMQH